MYLLTFNTGFWPFNEDVVNSDKNLLKERTYKDLITKIVNSIFAQKAIDVLDTMQVSVTQFFKLVKESVI